MVANEIGSGQVDVFLGDDGGRWTTSPAVVGIITPSCRSSRPCGPATITRVDSGGGGSTASAPTTPPGGHVINCSHDDDDVGWVDTSQEFQCDIGPSETDEKGGGEQERYWTCSSPSSSSSDTVSSSIPSDDRRLLATDVDDAAVGLRISQQHSHGDVPSSLKPVKETGREPQGIGIGVVNDALDAPADDKMPHQYPQESGWAPDCDETHVGDPCGGIHVLHAPLKSALKRTTTGGSRGGLHSLSRKKARVRFNEALNTFLECDYVIYVDDDEYDLLYHLDAVAAAAAAAQAEAAAAAASSQQPQLVNVRSFQLQLPETSTVATAVAAPPTSSGADPLTLSPPDGYKDAAAFYAAAAAALVDLENRSGCVDDGVDPWEEDYDDDEAMADEAEANGWADPQSVEAESQGQQEQMDDSAAAAAASSGDLVLPDPPKTGILKGGKLWRGAVNNNNNNNSSADGSQNNSTPTCSTTSSSSAGGEEATLSRHGEKSPAVRFIHLNDSQADCESSGAAGGQAQKGGHHHSAFQQLFPRARKLLQELPEAEIQRLTTAARANNAPSSVSSSKAVTSLATQSTDTASDLKYEKALRVTETSQEVEESHPVAGGAVARLGTQYSADYYQVIKRIRSTAAAAAAEANRQQRKTDPPTTADSLVERLKWLTTDVDDPEESGVAAEEREAADGGSDPEILQLAVYASVAPENDEVQQEKADPRPVTSESSPSQDNSTPSNANASAGAAAVGKTGKSGSGSSGEKSTYRKLNELFFRSKSKDKNKESNNKLEEQWKNSGSALVLNRSFSPPPPAEVEPKMKPSKKPHLIHIVGLAGSKSASSSGTSGETLGRIPNVVPTVDHVYRAAVDLVTRNSQVASSGAEGQQSANDSYSLDDIDAALHAQMVAASASASAAAVAAGAEACLYLPAHRMAEDCRDETGGSRSSGSSGDSGLGSSHDTSLTGTDTDGSAQDELQAFVRQDATQGRIDRIKKRYSTALEDEAEDYGFLRRPSVRGIKTRFGSTSEIIQQMQAQLAPQPAVTAAKASGQTHVNWSSYADAEQSSIQAQALLDPREKRRSAMMAMTNSVHLPALPEDSYFQQQVAPTNHIRRDLPSRPASVMNIYGSTGDLYQHLRAPVRPAVARHPASSAPGNNAPPPHLLERTSSVSSVSSAIDASGIYGTIRRQPPQMVHPPFPPPDSVSPTREYAPQHQLQHLQQQLHHQLPLRMTVSTPGTYIPNPQQQQQRPMSQQMAAASVAAYYSAQDYAMQQQYQQQHYVYATLPAKRQSPYGVPAPVVSQPLDTTRYRQVLPPMTSQALRPTSAMADPRYSIPAHSLQPQQQTPAPLKDEREGPEGASSSPGLTHHDVNM